MSIKNRVVNKDLHVLRIDRPLSGPCAEELEQKFADARSFGVKTMVVDLADVAYIDSRGLAALVAGYKMFGSDMEHFRLAAPRTAGGHADRFWAAALAIHAADSGSGRAESMNVGPLHFARTGTW